MSLDRPRKDKRNTQFWRAIWFLWPYRWFVGVSIVCALFVSFAFAGGLGTLLPIMRVFLNGDTIQTWIDRTIVQRRIGVAFADQTDELRLVKVEGGGAAAQSGLKVNDVLAAPGAPAGKPGYEKALALLSDPNVRSVNIDLSGRPAVVPLPA